MDAIRGDADSGDEVSEETRMLVAGVRMRAAGAPTAEMLADLLAAPRERTAMSREQVRDLFVEALQAAREASYLMGKLAGLMRDEEDP